MPPLNLLFPGRPDYTGPTTGMFGLLHHTVLCESSHDVMERVAYVKQNKPKSEVAIRLHNMIYLGGCAATTKIQLLRNDYDTNIQSLCDDYITKRQSLRNDYTTKIQYLREDCDTKIQSLDDEILVYIKTHIPDCAWNGETLVFG